MSYTEQFAKWVDMFFGGFGGDPEGAENMGKALAEMRVFWSEQLADRREQAAAGGRPLLLPAQRDASTTSRSTRKSCSTCARC